MSSRKQVLGHYVLYLSAIRALMYLASHTMPDILICSKFVDKI